MDYAKYLEKEQPIAYQIFLNSIKNNEFFHAYLLSGQTGTPLLEIARFLAKSILCDHPNPFCCGTCPTCHRVDEGTYLDYIEIDTKKNPVKIEDIEHIESEFSKTASEKKGIKIYIINLIENMSDLCFNCLLKFLEEPNEDTYAILTTENEFRILPTILSRVEVIHFNLIDKKELIDKSIAIGVKEDDAELLVNFYNDESSILEESKDEDYLLVKGLVFDLFDNIKNKDKLNFIVEKDIVTKINNPKTARFFFDLLILFFKEAYIYSIEKDTIFKDYVNILKTLQSEVPHLNEKMIALMNYRNEIGYNLILSLLIIHAIKDVFGE